jgi:sterol desaturase/sphingolipid hydroxylase (fatty acid hydroxylase superfamily)
VPPPRWIQVSLFPLGVAVMTALALAGPALDPASALGLPPAANDVLVLLGAIVLVYPAIALSERLWPWRPEWNRPAGDVRADVAHLLLTGATANALFGASARVGAVAAAAWIAARTDGGLWPLGSHPLLQLALALWLAELGHWLFHWISHVQPLVWRLHAAHHSAPRLYWLNATRFHVLDLFCLVSFQTFPLIALGIDRDAFLAYAIFSALYGQLQHANVDVRTGPLDFVFSTPRLHRWHHSTDPREGNANYGAILIFWDLLFRTFFRPRARVLDGPVGIADLPRFPAGWVGQQLAPFRWAAIRRANAAPRGSIPGLDGAASTGDGRLA